MLEFIEKFRAKRLMGREITLVNGQKGICNIVAVLKDAQGRRKFIPGSNIVTDDGDRWYAVRGANESDYFTVVGMRLGTDNTTPTKSDGDVTTFLAGSGKAIDGTYPMTNDSDGDNTGSGVDIVSWEGELYYRRGQWFWH